MYDAGRWRGLTQRSSQSSFSVIPKLLTRDSHRQNTLNYGGGRSVMHSIPTCAGFLSRLGLCEPLMRDLVRRFNPEIAAQGVSLCVHTGSEVDSAVQAPITRRADAASSQQNPAFCRTIIMSYENPSYSTDVGTVPFLSVI